MTSGHHPTAPHGFRTDSVTFANGTGTVPSHPQLLSWPGLPSDPAACGLGKTTCVVTSPVVTSPSEWSEAVEAAKQLKQRSSHSSTLDTRSSDSLSQAGSSCSPCVASRSALSRGRGGRGSGDRSPNCAVQAEMFTKIENGP